MAVSPMAIAMVDGVVGPGAADDAAPSSLHDEPSLDLLLRAPAMVEFILPDDAPLYAATGADDWSGFEPEAARLAREAASGLDLVYDGAGGAVHRMTDPAWHGGEHVVADVVAGHDPLVDLGPLDGEPAALLPPALDAPAHADVTWDGAAHIGSAAPDLFGPDLSWLSALSDSGLPVDDPWGWSDAGGYIFDHFV